MTRCTKRYVIGARLATASSIMSCCVCDSCISASKGKNRYRLLHGTSAASLSNKETLTACIAEFFGATLDAFGLHDQSRLICYECSRNLEKIAKKEKEIQSLKNKILEHFQLDSDQFLNTTPVGAQSTIANAELAGSDDHTYSCTPVCSQLRTQPTLASTEEADHTHSCTPVCSQLRTQPTLASTEEAGSDDHTHPCTPVRPQQAHPRSRLNAGNASQSSSDTRPHPKRQKVAVSVLLILYHIVIKCYCR